MDLDTSPETKDLGFQSCFKSTISWPRPSRTILPGSGYPSRNIDLVMQAFLSNRPLPTQTALDHISFVCPFIQEKHRSRKSWSNQILPDTGFGEPYFRDQANFPETIDLAIQASPFSSFLFYSVLLSFLFSSLLYSSLHSSLSAPLFFHLPCSRWKKRERRKPHFCNFGNNRKLIQISNEISKIELQCG